MGFYNYYDLKNSKTKDIFIKLINKKGRGFEIKYNLSFIGQIKINIAKIQGFEAFKPDQKTTSSLINFLKAQENNFKYFNCEKENEQFCKSVAQAIEEEIITKLCLILQCDIAEALYYEKKYGGEEVLK